ncbi:TetR family transcriptional regulator [Gordonia sp. PP30]|uniref:TetR/AcrR family transcriptional regulator n=1 Tax=unclassified Gordonia (in: high G+C Gram-positive bacteria) TaxID=2657482 RepID=UPI001FFE3CC8|nr:TetR family transcriptional regulator [Gordonia sp. PP30]UQE76838.1 TetR family transcriptional regulator [Gordonia sp. PP30]
MSAAHRPVGRPDKTDERTAQILAAMAGVVARDGLTGATISKVAEAAGLRRTLVLHYFGNRDRLVDAFLTQTVAAYGTAMVNIDRLTTAQLIDAAFEPGIYHSDLDLAVWLDLVALAARDPAVRDRLHRLWRESWLPAIAGRIVAQIPGTDAARAHSVAYALVAVFEGHWSLVAQGVPTATDTAAAKSAAHALIGTLAR